MPRMLGTWKRYLNLNPRWWDRLNPGGSTTPTGVPNVLSSVISPDKPDEIIVMFDRDMEMSCNIYQDVTVKINGGAGVNPQTTAFDVTDLKKLYIVMASPFSAGDTVTWAYDDTGSCTMNQVADPKTEADNQTYDVDNQLTVTAPPPDVHISKAYTTTDGAEIIFETDGDVEYTFGALEFTVKYNGVIKQYAGINLVSSTKFAIQMVDASVATDVITLSYSSPANNLEDFTDYPVENKVVSAAPPPELDLDDDGNPDTVIYDDHGILVTEDDDSYNVDINGDGVEDLHINK